MTLSRPLSVVPAQCLTIGPDAIPALLVCPVAPGPRPVIIAQHGYAADKSFLLPLANLVAQHGFITLLPDAWGHGDRFPASGPSWLTELNADYFLRALRATARDLRTCVDWVAEREDMRADQVILAGFSMGAMAALLAATWDERVAGVVSVSGSSPADLVDISIAGSPLASEAARTWAIEHDVAPRLAALAPRPLLIQHGRPDDMVPVANALRLYEAARPYYAGHPDHLKLMLYEHTHVVSPEQIQDAVEWVCDRFADAAGSPEPDEDDCQSA